jgi:hypothetical protein
VAPPPCPLTWVLTTTRPWGVSANSNWVGGHSYWPSHHPSEQWKHLKHLLKTWKPLLPKGSPHQRWPLSSAPGQDSCSSEVWHPWYLMLYHDSVPKYPKFISLPARPLSKKIF